MKNTSVDYPPTPEQFGILFSQWHLLGEQLRAIVMAAARVLPDQAPFDYSPEHGALWQACEDALRLLKRCGQGATAPPWQEEEPGVYENEQAFLASTEGDEE